MKRRATENALGELHEAVAKLLLSRLGNIEEATSADINAAIKFLKDNGIEAVPEPGDDLDKLANALPNFPDLDEEVPEADAFKTLN